MQAHLKYHIILLLLLTGICHGLAQDFTTYTVSNGLAHQQVKALYQDSKGYMWIGTWDGLTRFDGHSFITYRHSPDDSTSIFSDEVYCITEDSTHALWVVTEKGLAKFNALENNFRRVYLRKSHKIKFNDAGRTCLAFDKYKRGWLLDREGLVGFDLNLTDVKYYDVSSFFNKYGLIIADSTGLWMAGSQGLFHFTFEMLRHEQKLNVGLADQTYHYSDTTLISPRGHNMTRSSDGAFIINIDNKHVFVTNIGSGELVKISNSFNGDERIFEAFGDVYEMSPGKIGLCTENNGLAILDLKTRSFGFGHPLQRIVGKQRVNAIFRDRQNNYWVGTQNELIKYTIPQLDFDAWLNEDGSENSLSGPFVSSLFLDSSKQLWAACKGGGLDCIDLQANSVKNVRIDEIAEMGGDLKTVRYIYGPADETLLMALDSSLYIWNKKTGSTRFLFKFPGYIYRVFKDQEKKLWIAGSPHILIVHYLEGEVIIVDTLRTGTHCRDICETRKKEMFFATHYGLMKLDSAAPGFLKTYLPPGSEMDPEVFCIHENRDGTLWVGSIRSGIFLFDPQEEIFVKHLSSDNGLMDNSVNGFLHDDHGFLWLSTWKGIVRFDPIEEKVENFGKINGLPVWDFTTGAYLQDDEGNIYFGGMGGVIRFHPDSLVRFMPEYDLQIVGVNANNQRLVLDYPIGDDDMLTLDYDQRDFSMDFSSFDFRHPDQRIYRYKLNGIDKDWRNVKNFDLAARFSGITSGNRWSCEPDANVHQQPSKISVSESKCLIAYISFP